MGVFGIALRGFGKALKKHKQGKMLKGKSTREDRLKYGERGSTIKSVKPAVPRDASPSQFESSRQHGHTKVWADREKISKGLEKKIKEGKDAIKKRAHLGQTKVLQRRHGQYRADASTGSNTEPYSPPVKKVRKIKKKVYDKDIPF